MTRFSFLTALLLGCSLASPGVLRAQVFNPDGGALQTGLLSQPYSDFILATIPDSTTVDGEDVASMLIQEFPPLALFITEIQGLNYPMDIESVEFTASGLPEGMGTTCTPSSCRWTSGNTGSFVFSGTPEEEGVFIIEIASYTRGTIDISQLTANVGLPGLPQTFDLPQGLHTLFDTEYELTIEAPSGLRDGYRSQAPVVIPDRNGQQVNVRFPVPLPSGSIITVTDITGRVVASTSISSPSEQVSISMREAANGLHVLHVSDRSGHQASRFFF